VTSDQWIRLCCALVSMLTAGYALSRALLIVQSRHRLAVLALSAYSGGMCIQQLTLFTTPITYRIVFAIAASLCGLVYVVFGMRTDIRGGK
jgi:hypothetical protein